MSMRGGTGCQDPGGGGVGWGGVGWGGGGWGGGGGGGGGGKGREGKGREENEGGRGEWWSTVEFRPGATRGLLT